MNNKLKFLTKMSLNKKIKTKWFLVANILFLILVVGLINIDSIIRLFGGKFNEESEIIVIDNVNLFDEFKMIYDEYSDKFMSDGKSVVVEYKDTYDKGMESVKDDDKILLVIDSDINDYFKAKIVSNTGLSTSMMTIINSSLTVLKNELVYDKYNITDKMLSEINMPVAVESVVLSDSNTNTDMMTSTILEVIMLPIFMLIMFLVQMIGAEINEEKSTRSMEIIISNVSPKVHFMSKVLASNLFVLIQGGLILLYGIMGIFIRYLTSNGNILQTLDGEVLQVIDSISLSGVANTLYYMIPIILVMVILTFLAYSLLAGILASMTTNLEDFQQLQTPIVIISLIGFYLSMMAGLFKGSIFIKIMSYIPFVSAMLAPTLYVMGEIGIIDLSISIVLLVMVIYLLIKYGLRIYKVGILNYSQSNLWKKMFKAMKGK